MARFKTGKEGGVDILSVDSVSKAIHATEYDIGGVHEEQIYPRFTLQLTPLNMTGGISTYAIVRNGLTKKVRLKSLEITLNFTGTAGLAMLNLGLWRIPHYIPTQNYVIGVDVLANIVKEDSASVASTIAYASVMDVGQGLSPSIASIPTGILALQNALLTMHLPKSVTGKKVTYVINNRDIELNPNEAFYFSNSGLQNSGAGDDVRIQIYWEEI